MPRRRAPEERPSPEPAADGTADRGALVVPAVLLARFLARYAVRNTALDDLHAGAFPVSRAGDYSDVTVQTPDGPIPWTDVSRLSDAEMRALMLEVEVQLARALETVLEWQRVGRLDELLAHIEAQLFGPGGVSWDRPRHEQGGTRGGG